MKQLLLTTTTRVLVAMASPSLFVVVVAEREVVGPTVVLPSLLSTIRTYSYLVAGNVFKLNSSPQFGGKLIGCAASRPPPATRTVTVYQQPTM